MNLPKNPLVSHRIMADYTTAQHYSKNSKAGRTVGLKRYEENQSKLNLGQHDQLLS